MTNVRRKCNMRTFVETRGITVIVTHFFMKLALQLIPSYRFVFMSPTLKRGHTAFDLFLARSAQITFCSRQLG